MSPVRRALIEAEIALAVLRVERVAVVRTARAFLLGALTGAIAAGLVWSLTS